MNKKCLLLIVFSILPIFAFATTGDTTFGDITTQIKAYLGGSLGLTFVLIGFVGAGAAIAGFAPMKVMFPVFGLTMALHYGPAILEKIFAATGDYASATIHHTRDFTPVDLIIVLLAAAIFIIGIHKSNQNKIKTGA